MKKLFQKAAAGNTNDQLARRLAASLVRRQRQLTGRLNQWALRYPKQQQKRMLGLFCLVWLTVLGLNIWLMGHSKRLPQVSARFYPVHIGQPSGLLPQKYIQTDSLTLKNKANGNATTKR